MNTKQFLWLATMLDSPTKERMFDDAPEPTDLERRVREIETALRLRPPPEDEGELS